MERKRKRDILTKDEQRALKKFVAQFPAVIDAAEIIGIHRNVLDNVLIKGSGAPETIEKIRDKIAA